jgi:hypothetical protein
MTLRISMVAFLLAAGCGGGGFVGGDVDALGVPTARTDVPAARTGWAWVGLWRKVAGGERGLFGAIVSADAEFVIHHYDAASGEEEKRTVTRRAWLAEALRLSSSDDRDVNVTPAAEAGPVAEIRGWDAVGRWRYTISAGLKADERGGLVAVKLGLLK